MEEDDKRCYFYLFSHIMSLFTISQTFDYYAEKAAGKNLNLFSVVTKKHRQKQIQKMLCNSCLLEHKGPLVASGKGYSSRSGKRKGLWH